MDSTVRSVKTCARHLVALASVTATPGSVSPVRPVPGVSTVTDRVTNVTGRVTRTPASVPRHVSVTNTTGITVTSRVAQHVSTDSVRKLTVAAPVQHVSMDILGTTAHRDAKQTVKMDAVTRRLDIVWVSVP